MRQKINKVHKNCKRKIVNFVQTFLANVGNIKQNEIRCLGYFFAQIYKTKVKCQKSLFYISLIVEIKAYNE